MAHIAETYRNLVKLLEGRAFEGIALLMTRLALAGIFWRSGRTKVVEGTWLQIDETQYFLFEEFGLPLSPQIMVPLTTYAEFFLPVLVAVGLATRLSSAGLLVMALVIQVFVFPTSDHFFGWAIGVIAMAAILISRGGGMFSLDALITRLRS